MKKFSTWLLSALILMIAACSAFAAETVKGDVIVVFKNNTGNKVSTASLAEANIHNNAGEHLSIIKTAAEETGAKLTQVYSALSEHSNSIFALFHSDTKSEQELLEELRARPDVAGVSLNYIRNLYAEPDDTFYKDGKLWGMKAINANKVWANNYTGSNNVYVAVIDSGIDADHEDLAANVATEYCRAWTVDSNNQPVELDNYSDINSIGHGTHVSGIIAAVGGNAKGVAGVTWNTKIIMFKPLDSNNKLPDALVILALNEIVRLKDDEGLNIAAVNLSIGGWETKDPAEASNSTDAYWTALKAVSDAGVVICISAGNDSQQVGYPAPCTLSDSEGNTVYNEGEYCFPASFRNIPNMIVVAAASQDSSGNIIRSSVGAQEAGSNYGSDYVHIAAPGAHIVSTVPDDYVLENEDGNYVSLDLYPESLEFVAEGANNYARWAGTSMAAPHVTGAVALLKAAFPLATADQIKNALLTSANADYCKSDKGTVTYTDGITRVDDNTSKYGFLDVQAAFKNLQELMSKADDVADDYAASAAPSGNSLSSSEILDYGLKITELDSSIQKAANSGRTKSIAVLPMIQPISTGTYYIRIPLNSNHGTGTPRFFKGENGSINVSSVAEAEEPDENSDTFTTVDTDYDSSAKFYTESLKEIKSVIASDNYIVVKTELTAGTTYTPVLSVYNKKKDSSSGCNAGLLSALTLIAFALFYKNYKFYNFIIKRR